MIETSACDILGDLDFIKFLERSAFTLNALKTETPILPHKIEINVFI